MSDEEKAVVYHCPECTEVLKKHQQGFFVCDKCKDTFDLKFVYGYWRGYDDACRAEQKTHPAPNAPEAGDGLCTCGHALLDHKDAKIGRGAGCYHKKGRAFCGCLNSRRVVELILRERELDKLEPRP